MRQRHRIKRYRLPSSQKHSSNFLYWLVVLALIVLLAWIWRESGKSSRQKLKSKTAAGRAAETPRPPNTPARPALPRSAAVEAVPAPAPTLRAAQSTFEAQLALIQHGISPGSLDGAMGSQTRAALAAFQEQQRLPVTGHLDEATRSRLLLTNAACTTCTVTASDLARLQPVAPTWLGKSQQTALDYETILELVAEKSFAHPDFIRRLNPSVNWSNVVAGTVLQVPDAAYPEVHAKAAFVRIHLAGKSLDAFDENTNLLAHFPCSIAKLVEKRPVGELHVQVIAPHPNYTFNPEVFPESPEAQELGRKLILPPGPNNPVGVAWIGLDLPGYGIHGTPKPEEVGRTESHGCFRLANWNAEYLLRLITMQTVVHVEE